MKKKVLIIGIILFIIGIICLIYYFTTHKIITKDLTNYVERTVGIELSDISIKESGKVECTPQEDFAYICLTLKPGSIETAKNRLNVENKGIFKVDNGFNSIPDLMWHKLHKENIVAIYNKFAIGKTFMGSTQKSRNMYIYLSTDDKGNEFLYLFG